MQTTSMIHFMLFINKLTNYRTITMAGAGAPFVTPMFWPAGYVLAAFSKSKDDKPNKVKTGFFQ
jgi:hypothetical protein